MSGKARSSVKHFLKNQRQAEAVGLGERLLENALTHSSCTLTHISEDDFSTLIQELNLPSKQDLFYEIGTGNQVALVIAQRLMDMHSKDECLIKEDTPLAIKGTEGVVVTYANCCQPIPGDPIVGCLEPGIGIIVHVENCPEVESFRRRPEKFIIMRWEEEVEGEFDVDITIDLPNKRGTLAQVSSAIAEVDSNIENIFVELGNGDF